jgi:prepilin-type N-terminal cleavage/methylation domain-containing protein
MRAAFTLIELLLVIAIIGLLAAVVTANFSASSMQARDAERQADIRMLQQAIEAYKNREGRYPEQCAVGGQPSGAGFWSGQLGTSYECDDGTGQYIVGLAPGYIPVLPADKKLNGGTSGYVYRTNVAGTVYKVMAMNTVEADDMLQDAAFAYVHPLRSCDITTRTNVSTEIPTRLDSWSLCHVFSTGPATISAPISQCQSSNSRFQTSYAAWGGFATPPSNAISTFDASNDLSTAERYMMKNTTDVICQ